MSRHAHECPVCFFTIPCQDGQTILLVGGAAWVCHACIPYLEASSDAIKRATSPWN